mgnify:CR=1 FL=1
MSFTLEQLTAVKAAIASGTLEVEFNGKRVKYRSMSELREAKDITFPVRPIYKAHGIEFVHDEVTGFLPQQNRVLCKEGPPLSYDYLLIGTGPKVDYDYIPGLRENSYSIVGLAHAERTREGWKKFLADPGPVVIASAQGAACSSPHSTSVNPSPAKNSRTNPRILPRAARKGRRSAWVPGVHQRAWRWAADCVSPAEFFTGHPDIDGRGAWPVRREEI